MTKNNIFFFIFCIGFALLFSRCYFDNVETLYPSAISTDCDTTHITFSQSVMPIYAEYCESCHSSTTYTVLGGGYNLDGYQNFVKYQTLIVLDIEQKVGTSYNAMPKGASKLSNCKITIIKKWIEQGSLQN